MAKSLFLPEALDDLFVIWDYVALQSQSAEIADRLIERIEQKAELYAGQPETGELRPDLTEGVRNFLVDNYVVFYVSRTDGIEVIQIIHGSRDVPRHFRK
jgi:toxin ParE1/3/4